MVPDFFTDESVPADSWGKVIGLGTRLGMQHRAEARFRSVFIMHDCTDLSVRVRWESFFWGGRIGTVEWLESVVAQRKLGPCLIFKGALTSRRIVWPSRAFVTGFPLEWSIFARCVEHAPLWQLLHTEGSFLQTSLRLAGPAVRNKRPFDCVALVAPAEKTTEDRPAASETEDQTQSQKAATRVFGP